MNAHKARHVCYVCIYGVVLCVIVYFCLCFFAAFKRFKRYIATHTLTLTFAPSLSISHSSARILSSKKYLMKTKITMWLIRWILFGRSILFIVIKLLAYIWFFICKSLTHFHSGPFLNIYMYLYVEIESKYIATFPISNVKW